MSSYKFLSWIDIDKLDMNIISTHHQAIQYLEENLNKINWKMISYNKAAVHLIKNNLDKICWDGLCSNASKEVLPILQENIEKVNWSCICRNESSWINNLLENNIDKLRIHNNEIQHHTDDLYFLSRNTEAIPFLEKHIELIYWDGLHTNKNAIHLLDKYNINIDFTLLHRNPNPEALKLFVKYRYHRNFMFNLDFAEGSIIIPILKRNPHLIDSYICRNENPDSTNMIKQYIEDCNNSNSNCICWDDLSENPAATSIMKENIDKIQWDLFCALETHDAIEIIRENLDKVDWDVLSANKMAIHILKENQDKINWNNLSTNEGIYEEIYEEIEINERDNRKDNEEQLTELNLDDFI